MALAGFAVIGYGLRLGLVNERINRLITQDLAIGTWHNYIAEILKLCKYVRRSVGRRG